MATPEPNTQAQREIAEWIAEKWKGGPDSPCEACGHVDWAIAEPITITVGTNIAPNFSGQVRFAMVICQTCANTRLLHLMGMESIRNQGHL